MLARVGVDAQVFTPGVVPFEILRCPVGSLQAAGTTRLTCEPAKNVPPAGVVNVKV